ncbi:MAG: hypothetical protein WHT63_08535, partial [Tepidiforma sp.]
SSYAPAEEFPNCQPPHDKISVIEVPLDDPASAALVNEPESVFAAELDLIDQAGKQINAYLRAAERAAGPGRLQGGPR